MMANSRFQTDTFRHRSKVNRNALLFIYLLYYMAVDIHVPPVILVIIVAAFIYSFTNFLPDPSRFNVHHHPSHLFMGLIPKFCYTPFKFKFCSRSYSYQNNTRTSVSVTMVTNYSIQNEKVFIIFASFLYVLCTKNIN